MKSKTFNYVLKKPAKHTKIFKEIERMLAEERASTVRRKAIETAHFMQKRIADSAPTPLYSKIINDLPLEKMESKNSGFDFEMNGRAEFSFALRISPRRYPLSQYKGYNPVWGLLVSNSGRPAIDVPKNHPIPIPIDGRSGKRFKAYCHPVYEYGYKNRYKGKKVVFVTHVDAVQGTRWIDKAVSETSKEAMRIFAGR